jgi:hypothetical protein
MMSDVIKLVQQIMELNPADRSKLLAAVAALDGSGAASGAHASVQGIPAQGSEDEMGGFHDEMEALASIQAWYEAQCVGKDHRTQYRLMAAYLTDTDDLTEIDFLQDKLAEIRKVNKLFAVEVAFTDLAYKQPISTLAGVAGLILLIWQLLSGAGRGRILF